MQIIEKQNHFWELYRQQEQYYLGFAVDTGDAMHCWHLQLTAQQILDYKQQGRAAIEQLAKIFTQHIYQGNFKQLKAQQVDQATQAQMQQAYKVWHQTVSKT